MCVSVVFFGFGGGGCWLLLEAGHEAVDFEGPQPS